MYLPSAEVDAQPQATFSYRSSIRAPIITWTYCKSLPVAKMLWQRFTGKTFRLTAGVSYSAATEGRLKPQ
jgi:hypothetical protein